MSIDDNEAEQKQLDATKAAADAKQKKLDSVAKKQLLEDIEAAGGLASVGQGKSVGFNT